MKCYILFASTMMCIKINFRGRNHDSPMLSKSQVHSPTGYYFLTTADRETPIHTQIIMIIKGSQGIGVNRGRIPRKLHYAAVTFPCCHGCRFRMFVLVIPVAVHCTHGTYSLQRQNSSLVLLWSQKFVKKIIPEKMSWILMSWFNFLI